MTLDFFNSVINLKKIPRQGWIEKLSLKNPESVAEHIFMMSVIGMIISDSENYNTEKILKMILLHDLAESKIGDFTPEQISKKEKLKLENNAMIELFGMLPSAIKEEYQRIWQEFSEQKTLESQLVHEIDKFEMALQAKKYEQTVPKEKLKTFYQTASNEIKHPKIKELFTKVLGEE